MAAPSSFSLLKRVYRPFNGYLSSLRHARASPNFGELSTDRSYLHNIEKPRNVKIEAVIDESLTKFKPTTSSKPRIEVYRKNHQVPKGESYTQHWVKGKYHDDWLRINRKTKIKSCLGDSETSWTDFCPDILDESICSNVGKTRPTPFQRNVIRVWNTNRHLFIFGETGSGKTFSYLLPLLSTLIRTKKAGKSSRAIVLQSTKSLNLQTCSIAKKLTGGSLRISSTEDEIVEDWDLLFATPGRLQKHSRKPGFDPKIATLVLDEADMLLDESFVEDMKNIFSFLSIRDSKTDAAGEDGANLVFVSAIKNEEVEAVLDELLNRRDVQFVSSNEAQKIQENIEFLFLRIREMDKIKKLIEICNDDLSKGRENKTIIFCKDNLTVTFVTTELNKHGIHASRNLEARIIVAADSCSRGIDLPSLSHVINFDMPTTMEQFLLRSGRVGRLSSRFTGRCTSFVRTHKQVDLVNRIERIFSRKE